MPNGPETMEGKVSAIYTDMKWVKESLHKKANKWVEKVMAVMMLGILAWTGEQLINLIEVARAAFNIL